MPTPHIEEELLERYAMGTLPKESIPEIEEHLLSCSFCQSRLEEADEFLVHFRAAATQMGVRPAPFWNRFWTARKVLAGGAAAVATAALLMLFISGERHDTKLPPAMVLMQSLRGPESHAQIASGRPCLLIFDVPIMLPRADYEIEIVDTAGNEILKAGPNVKETQLTLLVEKLAPGVYWVRVYRRQPVRELVAEYGLQAE
jgi:hypothetical protein